MLRHVLFDLNLFPTESERVRSQTQVLVLLEALTLLNQFYLETHPNTPLLYRSGITYKLPAQFEKEQLPEVETVRGFLQARGANSHVLGAFKEMSDQLGGGEHFRDIPRIIENGGGDCDNLATWRAAELRSVGIDAQPYITWRVRPDGGYTYHVIVVYPDGTSEDPSLLCGMGAEARAADREEEQRKLGERLGDMMAGDFSTTFGPAGRPCVDSTRILGSIQAAREQPHDRILGAVRAVRALRRAA